MDEDGELRKKEADQSTCVTDVSRFPTKLYTYSATFAFRLHNEDRGRILEKQNGHFSEFISSFTRASQSCRTRRGWKIHVAKYSLLGFTYANERNNITIELRGRTRCDEFNYRFSEGENIFLECTVSIFETRRNQRRVAVYFGESSMEYYYRSRQRSFR